MDACCSRRRIWENVFNRPVGENFRSQHYDN
ncbi:hypothetical protein EN829_042205 [Mesorhizobium sp. M00.F.Ca.ET.186.01.1.1]|nr:hypothetical protein EN829_042205 [Mesorhizobium sp. M00.F.Ca.ET.186.01.1.1]